MSGDRSEPTRLWLAVRVRQLWNQARGDLPGARAEFELLVAEYGRWQVARAVADAGLPAIPEQTLHPDLSDRSRDDNGGPGAGSGA